jgi:hypothetical protein
MEEKKQIKSGYKTTEFWLTIAAYLLSGIAVVYSDSNVGTILSSLVAGLATLGYSVSRGIAKK